MSLTLSLYAYTYGYIQWLAQIVPRCQYMGYKLREHMFQRILEALRVRGRFLGGLRRGLARTWETLGVCGLPWIVLGRSGSFPGVAVSATDRFVMYTIEFMCFCDLPWGYADHWQTPVSNSGGRFWLLRVYYSY